MANTFKLTSNAGLTTSLVDQYTVPSSTTSIVVGMSVSNTSANSITVDIKIVSDTGSNENAYLVKGAPVPSGSSLEIMSGNKIVVEASDIVKVDCSVSDKVSATLSIMEIDV